MVPLHAPGCPSQPRAGGRLIEKKALGALYKMCSHAPWAEGPANLFYSRRPRRRRRHRRRRRRLSMISGPI